MKLVAFDRCAAGQSGRSAHGAAIVVTATLLVLFVLPVLYSLISQKSKRSPTV